MLFGKKKTLSDIIDERKAKKGEKARLEELEFIKADEAVEKVVKQQFYKAKEIIGRRLSYTKSHSSIYNFYFEIESGHYAKSFIHSSETNIKANFEFTLYTENVFSYDKIKHIQNKEFILDELGDILIEWCKLTEEE